LLGFVKRLELMVADGARAALLQTTAGMLQAIQAQITAGTPKHNQVGVVLCSLGNELHCEAEAVMTHGIHDDMGARLLAACCQPLQWYLWL
jgi:hypothetical protein